jgi:hypothetical protein
LPAVGFFIAPSVKRPAGKPRRVFSCLQHRSEQMPFEKGKSGNPAGRPPGARNKATLIAEKLLQGEAKALTRAVIERALAGDMAAVRVYLDIVAPVCRHRTIAFKLPPLVTAADAVSALAAIIAAVAAGELTLAEAGKLSDRVERFRRTLQATDFEQRLAKLQRYVDKRAAGDDRGIEP